MSLASACFWTLVRTVVLCLVAWPICVLVERRIRTVADRWRPAALGLVLAPALFPELLVGYTYRDAALSSARLAEWLCFGLLLIRVVPVGVVTLLASPLSLASRTAIYCRWMLLRANPESFREMWRFGACFWHGPIRRALPALGLMSVIAFQEFELAALLQTASWTDWFIAAQRVGLDRGDMLAQSLWPILIQLPLLAGVVYWTVRRDGSRMDENEESGFSGVVGWEATIYLGLALLFGCFVPLGFMATNVVNGLKMILRQPTQLTGLGQEMAVAASISVCAGFAAWFASRWFLNGSGRLCSTWGKSTRSDPPPGGAGATSGPNVGADGDDVATTRERLTYSEPVVVARKKSPHPNPSPRKAGARGFMNVIVEGVFASLLLPGLAGSLLLSLASGVLFQQPWLRPLYDTPLPWGFTLIVWLLPRAVLVRLWLETMTRTEGLHLAEMLAERRLTSRRDSFSRTNAASTNAAVPRPPLRPATLLFRLRDQPRILAVGLLCYWAYLDLSTAYLLAPSGMPSGLVRLYNFMHFGRSSALSAEAFLFFGIPLVVIAGAVFVMRVIRGRVVR